MDNRIYVYTNTGGSVQVVGQATAQANMKCRLHARSGGSESGQSELNPTDYLKIQSVSDNIVTAISDVSGISIKEYCHNVYVSVSDTVLNAGDDWPAAATHFAFGS